MDITNKIELLKSIQKELGEPLRVNIINMDKEYADIDKNSKKALCIHYAFNNSCEYIGSKLREQGFKVVFIWESNYDMSCNEGYNNMIRIYKLPLYLKDCKITLGAMHLKEVYGIELRDIEYNDIENIVEQEKIYFTEDTEGTRKKYIDIVNKKDYEVKVLATSTGEYIGHIRYKVTDSKYLSERYPNVKSTIEGINGKILYLSSIIIKKKFSKLGIGNSVINMLINQALNNNIDYFMAFSVKDGVTGHINSKGLFEELGFILVNEVPDAWNQSESNINYCPSCNKTLSNICKCYACVYVKNLSSSLK